MMYKVSLGSEKIECETLKECVKAAEVYRDETDMRASTMPRDFGKVTLNGKKVFEIMYNGRVKDCSIDIDGLDDKYIYLNIETNGYYRLDSNLNEIEVDRSSLNFFR